MGTRHTSDAVDLDLLAIGILQRADQFVMVRPAVEAARNMWFFPGGLIEGGELAVEGLKRELREETGVEVVGEIRAVFVSRIDRPDHDMQTVVFGFSVVDWQGELKVYDDGEIDDVALVPVEEACQRLRSNSGWLGVQEPLLAYLENKAGPGAMWFFREGPTGQQRTAGPIGAG